MYYDKTREKKYISTFIFAFIQATIFYFTKAAYMNKRISYFTYILFKVCFVKELEKKTFSAANKLYNISLQMR